MLKKDQFCSLMNMAAKSTCRTCEQLISSSYPGTEKDRDSKTNKGNKVRANSIIDFCSNILYQEIQEALCTAIINHLTECVFGFLLQI